MTDERHAPILPLAAPAEEALTGIVRRSEWSESGRWRGFVDGIALGTNVTVVFYEQEEVGVGPTRHVHPYDEVFIVREGRARFTIGDTVIEGEAGDVLFGPANVPHAFVNLGPGRLETTDIHLSDRWIQTELPDPDA